MVVSYVRLPHAAFGVTGVAITQRVTNRCPVYVTAALEGRDHGRLEQTATPRILSPGQDSASAPVVISC